MGVRFRRVVLPGVLFALGFGGTGPLLAQDTVPAPTPAEMEAFARAYLEIAAARDESYAELGRTHESQGKALIRQKMEDRIGQILESHGLTRSAWMRLTWVVSADGKQRAAFEKLIADLSKKEGDRL